MRALAAAGAHPVAAAADAAENADAVLVSVFDDAQVREVCVDGPLPDRMPRGSVVVVHTTGDPDTAAAVADRAAARDVHVVDAPVSGGPHDIAAGRISLFVGGADDAVARVRPALRCYGDPVLHVGALGAGQRVKLLNNAVFAAQIGLLAEAPARRGVRRRRARPARRRGHRSAASRAQAGVASRGSVARFAEAVGGFLGKDMDVVRRVAAEHGADLGALGGGLDALAGALDAAAGERTTTSTAG
ncbi:NAD(P)-binding domain-containing protein [Actinomadura sp. CNU-125]|uniref:NAD(P)-binding domain-containing protein n=1 Tax=Actinomadura sp. CNU-125 TaxID=1904961 RepID=UPI0021CC9132|nr:NAD(P)-binding domain-containing protein [Actinomadura sp. CNU-125]